MIDARQSVRRTVGSRRCRSWTRRLPVQFSGRHPEVPVFITVGTLAGVRSAADLNACGTYNRYFLTGLIAYTSGA
jgi:hypothetical protein